MIVELFGLPASGKTTLAKQWEHQGWTRVRLRSRRAIFFYFSLFFFHHPLKTIRLFFLILRFTGGIARGYLKITNLFFYNLALYQKATRYKKVVLDQGPHQILLSLFEHEQSSQTLESVTRLLPRPSMLLVLSTDEKTRAVRLAERRVLPREQFGKTSALQFAKVSEKHFLLMQSYLREQSFVKVVPDSAMPEEVVYNTWSYVTFARMPTEKAHGVSIAHMCHSFGTLGKSVQLVIPKRKNPIKESVFEYYGIPENFDVVELPVADLLGGGFSHSIFFFIQRLLFLQSVKKYSPKPGVIYTRDAEIAYAFRKSRHVVYEAHRMPRGVFGWLTLSLVREVALVVCNSKGTETAFNNRGVVNTLVAPNGFDPALFSSPLSSRDELGLPEGFLALYVGSDQAWKGIDVFRAAAKENPEIHHVIVGGRTKKIEGNLVEMGVVPAHLVPRYIRHADVVVVPNTEMSEESVQFTSPIKLFEYLGAGKPIIASDVSSIREILNEKTAYFVRAGEVEALAHAISTLKQTPSQRESLAQESKKLGLTYTWDSRAKKIVDSL
ncbi:MAG: glycosyltransferase [Patescibacteria group bacterium]